MGAEAAEWATTHPYSRANCPNNPEEGEGPRATRSADRSRGVERLSQMWSVLEVRLRARVGERTQPALTSEADSLNRKWLLHRKTSRRRKNLVESVKKEILTETGFDTEPIQFHMDLDKLNLIIIEYCTSCFKKRPLL